MEDVRVETVMEYLAGIGNPRTRRSSAVIVRKFLRFLGNNDGGHFKIPRRRDDDLPEVIDEADVLRMPETAENPCYRALVYESAARNHEMIDRYGRLHPTEVEDAYLQMYGLKRKEEPLESEPLMPKTCPRCKTVNPPTNRYCGRCSMILDETLSLEAERHEMRSFAEKLVKDPGFVTKFLDFLGENLTLEGEDGSRVPLKNVVTPKAITLRRSGKETQ